MRRLVTPCVLALVAGMAAPTLAQQAPPAQDGKSRARSDCFFADNVRGYEVVDDKTVNVRIGAKEIYQLTLFYGAFDMGVSTRIGIKPRGGARICSPLDASVIVPETSGPHDYPIKAIRRLTLAEIEAGKAKPEGDR